MNKFETGAVRDTGGKGRMDLIPWCSVIRISKHMEDSLTHYPERNWEKGLPMHSMIDSAFRHLAKYVMGMDDEDHLCAAATNLLMAMWTEENAPEMQDIPSRRLSDTSSLDSKRESERRPAYNGRGQGRAEEEALATCSCYIASKSKCLGTKEMDYCDCGGDASKCDWYPEVRERAKQG